MQWPDLPQDETDGGHSGRDQGGHHEEPEPPDDPLVVEPPDTGHLREGGLLVGDGEEDPVDHEAEEQEEDARRHPGQNDEGQSQLSPKVGHPDGVEGVLELHFPQGLVVTDSVPFC